MNSIRNC